ncbi:MAG: cytochrome c peroxidase [Saprospiraceae bacterium]|nr:cytochrome c peroxidase [Saprospiraceae bacterium]
MNRLILILFISIGAFAGCTSDEIDDKGVDLTNISYDPQPYDVELPDYFPDLYSPSDNPLTYDGVQLGRHLFYDPILSADSTMSCSSCHEPGLAFTDGLATSTGIDGIAGRRSSMSLINIGFFGNKLFWDGRSPSLEHQALQPVEDPIELHETWPNVERKLRSNERYRELFRKAFGIEYSGEITKELAGKAIAQFERILVSTNSRFDRERQGKTFFTSEEQDGFDMFFDDSGSGLPEAECGHCHNFPLFTTFEFFNNGLDSVSSLEDYEDKGLGEVTMYRFDNGKFKAPTLRNIELTAPYMHDGRFETLEEVLDHYATGGHPSPNVDPLVAAAGTRNLSEGQKRSIIAFLRTLTDTSYLQNPDVLSPFN